MIGSLCQRTLYESNCLAQHNIRVLDFNTVFRDAIRAILGMNNLTPRVRRWSPAHPPAGGVFSTVLLQ
jgi:hypothetical protein